MTPAVETADAQARRERAEATQRELWGRRPRDWAELAEPQNTGLFADALDAAGVDAGTDLLDIGCGSGLALSMAAQRGARVSGIDIAPTLLAVARERVPDGDLREGGLDSLPFADQSFDVVLSINALQFAADPAAALAEVHRVLRPGGRLAIGQFAAPERCESTALHLAMEALIPRERQADHAPYALSAPGALEQALADAQLTVVARPRAAGRVALWRPGPRAARAALLRRGRARGVDRRGAGGARGDHRGAAAVPDPRRRVRHAQPLPAAGRRAPP